MMGLGERLERARLVSLPRPAPREEYEVVAAELVDRLRTLPGAVAVFRTGSISAPGISDLDLVAVVEGEGPFPSFWQDLSERARYLAMHTPFLVDVETFRRHRWFAHMEPIECVWGSPLELEEPPARGRVDLHLVSEHAVVGLLRVARQALAGIVKVRPTLCELFALRHDLRVAGLTRKEVPDAHALVDEVGRLRGTWFEGDAGRLRPALAAAPHAFRQAIAALAARAGVAPSAVEDLLLGAPWDRVRLTAGDDTAVRARGLAPLLPGLPRKAAELAWRRTRVQLTLPPAMLALLRGEAASEGERAFLEERRRIVLRYGAFIRRSGNGFSALGPARVFLRP